MHKNCSRSNYCHLEPRHTRFDTCILLYVISPFMSCYIFHKIVFYVPLTNQRTQDLVVAYLFWKCIDCLRFVTLRFKFILANVDVHLHLKVIFRRTENLLPLLIFANMYKMINIPFSLSHINSAIMIVVHS